MLRNLARDLVAFKDMLECSYLEAEVVGHVHEHENLIGAVGMCVDITPSLKDFHKRLKLQVAARRNQIPLAACLRRAVLVPRSLVIARASECLADCLFDSHASRGVASITRAFEPAVRFCPTAAILPPRISTSVF